MDFRDLLACDGQRLQAVAGHHSLAFDQRHQDTSVSKYEESRFSLAPTEREAAFAVEKGFCGINSLPTVRVTQSRGTCNAQQLIDYLRQVGDRQPLEGLPMSVSASGSQVTLPTLLRAADAATATGESVCRTDRPRNC